MWNNDFILVNARWKFGNRMRAGNGQEVELTVADKKCMARHVRTKVYGFYRWSIEDVCDSLCPAIITLLQVKRNAIKNQQNTELKIKRYLFSYIKLNMKRKEKKRNEKCNINFKMNPLSTCLIHHLPIFCKKIKCCCFFASSRFTHLDVSYRPVLCVFKNRKPAI